MKLQNLRCMFEITNTHGNYSTFIIARRSVNCSTITLDDFIKFVKEDMEEALNSYAEVSIPKQIEVAKERNRKYVESRRTRIIQEAEKYALRKWKTQKRRDQHMKETLEKLDKDVNEYTPWVDNLTYFDFDGNCGTVMGINGKCILDTNTTDEKLTDCFEELVNSRYFNKAIGWAFMYNGDANSYRSAFRPKIKLLFDETTTTKIKKAAEALSNAVTEFYAHTNYWGD